MLVPGEMYPTSRLLDENVQGTPMEGIEHLGQYVYEMTQAKLKALGDEGIIVEEAAANEEVVDEDENMLGPGEEEDEDPLHENLV